MSDIVDRLEDWLAPSNESRDSELYDLVLAAAGVISSLRRQRNAQTFALQCFHSHAVKNGDDATASTIAEYLTAAGWPLEPEHWRIATADRDPGPSCETCGGLGHVVVGQTHDWPYGEQNQCPECADAAPELSDEFDADELLENGFDAVLLISGEPDADVCETCGGGGEVPGPITATGLWHKIPCPVCRPGEGASDMFKGYRCMRCGALRDEGDGVPPADCECYMGPKWQYFTMFGYPIPPAVRLPPGGTRHER